MPILLDKVLTVFATPLGLALAVLAAALLLLTAGRRKIGTACAAASFLLLWAAATPLVATRLLVTLESGFPSSRAENYPSSDVVIVLGGALAPATDSTPYPDLGPAADRVLHAWRIYKAGKAKAIFLTGGQVFDPMAERTEAKAMRELLVGWGVDPAAITIEDRSRNTYENANLSVPLLAAKGFRTALLVTSASHMPRALATFRKAGIAAEPAATDYGASGVLPPFPLMILPDASSLDATTRAVREWIGLFVYRLRGWA